MSELRENKVYKIIFGLGLFTTLVYGLNVTNSKEQEIYKAGKQCAVNFENKVSKYSMLSDDEFNNNEEISDFVKNKFVVKRGPFEGEKCVDVMEKYFERNQK